MATIITCTRNGYGQLHELSLPRELRDSATVLISQAVKARKIAEVYKAHHRGLGEQLHHELYDIAPNGNSCLLCLRLTEASKYGVATRSKNYFLIQKCGRGVRVTEAPKARASRAAQQAGEHLGMAIDIVTGKEKLRGKPVEKSMGYKAVAIDDTGALISAWDGSPWALGKARTEAARPDHEGGFYFYRTLAEVLDAAARNEIFAPHRNHHQLAIVAVEVSGNAIRYRGGKCAATRLRPLEVVAMTL